MTGPRNLFQCSRRFASGHVCGLVFGPHDLALVQWITAYWLSEGWCTWDERQLVVNDCHATIRRHRLACKLRKWVRESLEKVRIAE